MKILKSETCALCRWYVRHLLARWKTWPKASLQSLLDSGLQELESPYDLEDATIKRSVFARCVPHGASGTSLFRYVVCMPLYVVYSVTDFWYEVAGRCWGLFRRAFIHVVWRGVSSRLNEWCHKYFYKWTEYARFAQRGGDPLPQ